MICSASTDLHLGIEVNRGHIPSCADVLMSSSLLLRCKSRTHNTIVSHSRKLKDTKLAQVVEYEQILLGHYMTVLARVSSHPNQDRWSDGHHSSMRITLAGFCLEFGFLVAVAFLVIATLPAILVVSLSMGLNYPNFSYIIHKMSSLFSFGSTTNYSCRYQPSYSRGCISLNSLPIVSVLPHFPAQPDALHLRTTTDPPCASISWPTPSRPLFCSVNAAATTLQRVRRPVRLGLFFIRRAHGKRLPVKDGSVFEIGK